jgi:hypothetical protein
MPPRLSVLRFACAAALLAALAAASAAQAQAPPKASGPVRVLKPVFVAPQPRARAAQAGKRPRGAPARLSNRLALLATPAVRSASPDDRARRLGLPARGPGSLLRSGSDVVVRVRAASLADDTLRTLRQAGGRVLDVDGALRTVTVAVPPSALDALAQAPGVKAVTPELAPLTSSAGTSAAPDCHGAATSEADQQLHAADARQAYGVTGAGVKVGVISDSFDSDAQAATHAAGDVQSGDLPGAGNPCGRLTPVDVRDDAGGEDEGRAMAQVVHDLAPGASLAFAPASPENAFADRISDLADAGADVIVDDITFLDEPYFQEGPPAVAADQAAAAGIPYYSSAANNNLIVNNKDRASYEASSFRPTACPTLQVAGEESCMNFAAQGSPPQNAQPFVIAPGGTLKVDFQWAEPWFGVGTDLDLFLLDGNQNPIAGAQSAEDNVSSGIPFEFMSITNRSQTPQVLYLVIAKYTGDNPRLKWNLLQPRGNVIGVPAVAPGDITGPSIFGHNGAEGAMSVAAVPYDNSQQVETFSSRGPVTHYFGPVTSATPAAPLGAPQALAKPDIAATDGAATTFFAEDFGGGTWRFYGTSEAAPHAAAVAALEMEAAPNATAAQILAAQKSTAAAVGAFAAAARGAGLVNALAAVAAVRQPPTASTGAAGSVTSSGATLSGKVNPNGVATSVRFEYGPTTAYGSTTSTAGVGAGSADLTVSVGIHGLAPGTSAAATRSRSWSPTPTAPRRPSAAP